MTLSIIVPRYATTPEVAVAADANIARLRQLASVPAQVIVIDNGSPYRFVSTADTVVDLETVVAWPVNRGVAPAWNEGRTWAKGDVLAFVTTSVRVLPLWDAPLVDVARRERVIAMPYTNGAKPYGLGVTGWCWVIRRDLADEIGPFDETFVPAQYEDTDYFHRAIYDHGVELVNVPQSQVERTGSRTHSAGVARYNYLHMANRFRYAWKHDVDPNDVPPFWKKPLRDAHWQAQAAYANA